MLEKNKDILDISLGRGHTCILRWHNEVQCFGDNSKGQLVIRNKETSKKSVKGEL